MLAASFQRGCLQSARLSVLGACACLPVSTAGTNLFLLLTLLFWFASGRVAAAISIVRTNHIAALALVLLALLVASAAYSSAPFADQINSLAKARKLIYIPVVASLLEDDAWWRRCLVGLAISVLIGISAAFYLHWGLPGTEVFARFHIGGGKAAFKDYIVHGWFGALLVYGSVVAVALSRSGRERFYAAAIAFVASLDILFLEQGRAAALSLFLLVPLAAAMHFGRRGVAAVSALGVAALIAILLTQTPLVARIKDTISHTRAYVANPESPATSTGVRLAFYRYGLELVANRPVLGYGLGSVAMAYVPLTSGRQGSAGKATANPHNEFINLGIQAGAGAMAVYAWLLLAVARHACRIGEPARSLGLGLALLMFFSSLLNSSLWNFSEGFAFAILAGLLIPRSTTPSLSPPMPLGDDRSQRPKQDLQIAP
jgi:O-antigen ligase